MKKLELTTKKSELTKKVKEESLKQRLKNDIA